VTGALLLGIQKQTEHVALKLAFYMSADELPLCCL
jgi:hypothetical protein